MVTMDLLILIKIFFKNLIEIYFSHKNFGGSKVVFRSIKYFCN